MSEKKADIDISYIANLARLELSEEEKKRFTEDISNMLQYMERLNEVDVSDIQPTAHVHHVSNVWREDKKNSSFEREKMLANAPDTVDDELIKVPKVISE